MQPQELVPGGGAGAGEGEGAEGEVSRDGDVYHLTTMFNHLNTKFKG